MKTRRQAGFFMPAASAGQKKRPEGRFGFFLKRD
jgi:hypothetical protein